MKINPILIAFCSTSLLTLSACNMQQQTMPVEKSSTAVNTSVAIDLSKYQNQRAMCTKVTKKTVIDCQKQGGILKKQGMAQCYMCTINYADAGKVCSDKSDCQGACVIDYLRNKKMTTITIDDALIEEAKSFGLNEEILTDEISQFIRSKISLMQFRQFTKDNKSLDEKKTLSLDDVRGCLKDEIGKAQDNDKKNEEETAMLNMILADDNRTKSIG